MTTIPATDPFQASGNPPRFRLPFSRNHIPLLATLAVWLLLFAAASLRYDNFFSTRVFLNLFRENSHLGITAIGLTFVILAGGIDLSVGAMIAFVSILVGTLVHGQLATMHPLVAMGLALVIGTAFGAFMGTLVAWFAVPPFLVTLAGMFLLRGLALKVSVESAGMRHPFFRELRSFSIQVFPVPVLILIAALVAAVYIAHFTRFGRAVYAIGGNEQSAVLMGVPVRSVKVRIYALSGFFSALAGCAYTTAYSGSATAVPMLELDAIAAVVIGGTLLTGGVGYVIGTIVGVLILGIIQEAIRFEGTLSSWWTKIATGGLLLAFILLQKVMQGRRGRTGHA